MWSGGSKRAGADPGSLIRLEPIQEPGSVPAKPLGSLGSLSGPRVAAGLVVGRPITVARRIAAPDDQTGGDSRPPNATLILKCALRRAAVLAALLAVAAAPAVAHADVSSRQAVEIVKRQPAARTLAARAPRRALHRSARGQRLARDRAAGLPAHAARELARRIARAAPSAAIHRPRASGISKRPR